MLVVLVLVQVLVHVLLVQERMLVRLSVLMFSFPNAALWFWCMRATHTAGTGMDRSTRPRRAA